jgi:hypothetical protein
MLPDASGVPHELDLNCQFMTHHPDICGIGQDIRDLLVRLNYMPRNYRMYQLIGTENFLNRLIDKKLKRLYADERPFHDLIVDLIGVATPAFRVNEVVYNLIFWSYLPETPRILASLGVTLSVSISDCYEQIHWDNFDQLAKFMIYQSTFGNTVIDVSQDESYIMDLEFLSLYFPKVFKEKASTSAIMRYLSESCRSTSPIFTVLVGAKIFVWVHMIVEGYYFVRQEHLPWHTRLGYEIVQSVTIDGKSVPIVKPKQLCIESFFYITTQLANYGDALQYLLRTFDRTYHQCRPSTFIPDHAIDRERMIEFAAFKRQPDMNNDC